MTINDYHITYSDYTSQVYKKMKLVDFLDYDFEKSLNLWMKYFFFTRGIIVEDDLTLETKGEFLAKNRPDGYYNWVPIPRFAWRVIWKPSTKNLDREYEL